MTAIADAPDSATPDAGDTGPATAVTVRYFAAARAATGVDEEVLQVGAPATMSGAIAAMVGAHGSGLARVLDRCSYLLNAIAVHDHSTTLRDGDTVDVLPPFAGG